MIDDDSTYPSSDVVEAIANLLAHKRTDIAASIQRRFYWFPNHVSAPTVDELIEDAEGRLQDGRRRFKKHLVCLSDERSLMSAFVGVVLSIGNEHVKRLRREAKQFEQYEDDGSQTEIEPIEGSDKEYELPPDKVIELREERSRLDRIRPRSEANVKEFMEFLLDKDEVLHRVCMMRRDGKKNKEIALALNLDNKKVGNAVTELKRQATKFFSMPQDDIRRRTRQYRTK